MPVAVELTTPSEQEFTPSYTGKSGTCAKKAEEW
jgi:hypothetical protein